ncbi:MAG: type IV secretory system conjugative DNA transfer family protein [Clostridia bacterium]|nr:type IV secretory system conjugative DNA transfer family protein [Clostridia bacterium]
MAENRNKLRGGKSKAPVIYTITIIALLGLALIFYASYTYLGYIKIHKITNPGYEDIVNVLSLMFQPESMALPITPEVIKEVLVMQVRDLWWLYAGIALMVFLIITSKNPNDYRGMEQGSSKWADKYDEKQFKDTTGIPCGDNFYVTVENPKHKFYSSHNLNEIVIGGSGAGKSFRKIKPDIMQMTGSYVVTDPSGELYRDCAKLLRANGYIVRVLNLTNISLSNSYNPFKYMREEQDVLNIADLFMKNSAGEGEKEDFWAGAAQDMLVMIMLYLFKADDEIKSFGRVIRLVNSIQYKDGKIDETCELARCMAKHKMNEKNRNDAASINWDGLLGTPQETLGSIAKTLSTRLRLWAVEDVDMLTGEDEMNFDDLGVHKTAIFLIIPAARQTYKAVANIFYSQLFERLIYIASVKYNNRLPLLVSCELDEFANIGRIPNFDETLAVVRKYNIRICIVLQGLSQLKAIYEKTYDSIIGNCSIFTFLGTNDQESKEYLSKKLGKTTVRIDTKSYNRGNQGGGSDNESYVARDLLAPDEISRALKKGKNGKCIVFVDEFNPFFLDKFNTLKHLKIAEVGSSFKKDWHNNSDINADYAGLKAEREKRYTEQQKKAHQLANALATGNYDSTVSTEETREDEVMKKLEEIFMGSDNIISFNGAMINPDKNIQNIDDIEEV